jgi:hypothetical protein
MTHRQHLLRKSNNPAEQKPNAVQKNKTLPLNIIKPSSLPFTPEDILSLQRTIGNRAVMHMLGTMSAAALSEPKLENKEMDNQEPSGSVNFRSGVTDHRMPIQRKIYSKMSKMWEGVNPGIKKKKLEKIINTDPALSQAYVDLAAHLGQMDFQYVSGKQPEANMVPNLQQIYQINYGKRKEMGGVYNDPTRYVGAILHEMMHITAALQYATNVQPGSAGHAANMNLPVGVGNVEQFGLTDNQFSDENLGAVKQMDIMHANWEQLRALSEADLKQGDLTDEEATMIQSRIDYASVLPDALAHYDTVLVDLLYYLASEGVQRSQSYLFAQQMLVEANARRSSGQGAVQSMT